MKPSGKLLSWAICLLLVAGVMALFFGALDCGFVNYDDPVYVTSNSEVQQGLTWPGVAWAFTTDAAGNWHPLTWLSHMADVSCYGLSPRGHHFTSLLLHALNAILLFLVLRELTGATGRSAAVAAIFALHPLRVESVVWVSERKDVLSTVFLLLTLWAWARYTRGQRPKIYYGAALVCFLLGLMAKPMLVTLPFILLLLDYWPLQRWTNNLRALAVEKIPFFALAAASCAVTVVVQSRGGAVSSMAVLSLGQRVANAFVSYVRYIEKTFWPVDLSVLYPHPRDWAAWRVAEAVLVLTCVSAWVWQQAPKRRWLAVGWLWFLGALVPVIGLVQVGIQSIADRYTYVPAIGLYIMLAWGLYDLLGYSTTSRVALGAMGAAAAFACCVLTPRQTAYWTDSATLFKHAAAVTKDNYMAYNNIGYYLSDEGHRGEAMRYFQKSLSINPNYADAHNNVGFALAQMGSNQQAIAEYIKALSLNSNLTEAHNNLGNVLAAVGRSGEAMHEYQVALAENPHHADAHNNYGIALATHGQLDEAIKQFRMAIRDRPDYASAHSDLGNALAMQGKWNEAIEQYMICLKSDPADPQVHNNLANVLSQLGRLGEAVDHYHTALKLRSENPEAHFNLGYCLEKQGHRAEAIQQYKEALAERPDNPQARAQLEQLLRSNP